MSQKCAPSGSRQRVVSEAKSSQHDITKAHIKVFKYEQQVVKYDPQSYLTFVTGTTGGACVKKNCPV